MQKPKSKKFIDLEGQRFNKLIVIKYMGRENNITFWECLCDCGNITKVQAGALKSKMTKSCGCLRRINLECHGFSRRAEYQIYHSAKKRCTDTNDKRYKDWGGRGIEFRFQSFEEFINDVGFRPSKEYQLDRIDNNGHYELGNIRWISIHNQQRNKRNNRWLTFNEKTMCIEDWAKETGIHQSTLCARLNKYNWCTSCILTISPNKNVRNPIICSHIK